MPTGDLITSMGFTAALAAAVTLMLVSFALEAFFRLFRKLVTALLITALVGLPVAGLTVAVVQR